MDRIRGKGVMKEVDRTEGMGGGGKDRGHMGMQASGIGVKGSPAAKGVKGGTRREREGGLPEDNIASCRASNNSSTN